MMGDVAMLEPETPMGSVRIRYYRVRRGRGFWEPGAFGVAYGLRASLPCGPDGPEAWAMAEAWNAKLKAAREAARVNEPPPPAWPPGSLGSFFERWQAESEAWRLMKPRTQEDYHRAWPVLAERHGKTLITRITPQMSERLHVELHPAHQRDTDEGADLLTWNEAHRTLKVWRALLSMLVDYRLIPGPPPIGRVSNPAPKGREALFTHAEVMDRAWGAALLGYDGLAVAIRLGWDAMLSPVDMRSLPLKAWRPDSPQGPHVSWRRTKTGKRLACPVTPETAELVEAYLASLRARGIRLHAESPLVRRPNGTAYPYKDQFGDDYRFVRARFWAGDDRQLLDLRRSAATEARLGGAGRDILGKAMANRLDESDALFETYVLAAGRDVLAARERGRAKMGEAA